jgi:hypothetical protein
MALSGTSDIWHCKRGISPIGRSVQYVRYGGARRHGSSEEFLATFGRVVGEMGTRRRDLPEQELYDVVSGKKWAEGGLVPQ